jgi:hypothetical protein
VTMSFENSPHKKLSYNDDKPWTSSNDVTERPPLERSAATTPSYSAVALGAGAGAAAGLGVGAVASGSGSNPWAEDEEEFGREKEVEMSFE